MAGINHVKERLAADKLEVTANCPELIGEFKRYRWVKDNSRSENSPSERPVKKDDHALDTLRYMVAQRPLAPTRESPQPTDTWKDRALRESLKRLRRIGRHPVPMDHFAGPASTTELTRSDSPFARKILSDSHERNRRRVAPRMRIADPKPAVLLGVLPGRRRRRHLHRRRGQRMTGRRSPTPRPGVLHIMEDIYICISCAQEICEVLDLRPELHISQAREIRRLELAAETWEQRAKSLEKVIAQGRPDPVHPSRKRS